ncbi:hypothetical protein C8J55DRAFT_564975 [Lentinula edodes]|uniref:Uncharacterized protein n=1 Tax=Lentinula lateritia TaxID=40482 RepID=A0A9W8ZX88_9AGAR|nr:hypothetical protein C8J55DRAFT_564975 [Lentinula edodes]
MSAIVTCITAIKELAGAAILCSNKTGTLTTNKLVTEETLPQQHFEYPQSFLPPSQEPPSSETGHKSPSQPYIPPTLEQHSELRHQTPPRPSFPAKLLGNPAIEPPPNTAPPPSAFPSDAYFQFRTDFLRGSTELGFPQILSVKSRAGPQRTFAGGYDYNDYNVL